MFESENFHNRVWRLLKYFFKFKGFIAPIVIYVFKKKKDSPVSGGVLAIYSDRSGGLLVTLMTYAAYAVDLFVNLGCAVVIY